MGGSSVGYWVTSYVKWLTLMLRGLFARAMYGEEFCIEVKYGA